MYGETLQDFISEARIQDYVPLFVAKRVKGALRHHANPQKHHAQRLTQSTARCHLTTGISCGAS
ncbi:DUF3562 domain-containing protein [Cupriavidus necator]|uniref:DUF3562 domain-containing protein n=1 Tax=Cupriavidus necator TaxID=106590 RepID=UPI0023EC3E91|nr:DUF3562 domain-containing protein [Cupriavidus necator]